MKGGNALVKLGNKSAESVIKALKDIFSCFDICYQYPNYPQSNGLAGKS